MSTSNGSESRWALELVENGWKRRTEVQKVTWFVSFRWNLILRGFSRSLIIIIWTLKYVVQNSGSYVADWNSKSAHDLNETPFEARILLEFNGLKIWVFGVADYKSEFITHKYKMADPIWRTKMEKFTCLWWHVVLRGVWGRWLRIQAQN